MEEKINNVAAPTVTNKRIPKPSTKRELRNEDTIITKANAPKSVGVACGI